MNDFTEVLDAEVTLVPLWLYDNELEFEMEIGLETRFMVLEYE